MKVMVTFTSVSVGCHADGSFGHERVRSILARELERALDAEQVPALVEALQGEPSDDMSEEDEAIELLNAHCCAPSVYFAMVDGDLMLELAAS